ncbi:cobalamin biosynthesis protein CobD [Rhodoferax sp. 4810]|uniref:Cobalamin biosynthesis protein CobD n=1 Tax=Thiospirillum jenense TaxID=1653858 RepID=A0A839HCY7_9GAMM|nr:adenosylcobinamide-phosphate synthase CbiB [Thiospirillum jenense]MBB1075406.1 cobalamin biosynthesis protein CobD [Rhodoferax jenense]MBB1126783.1 cobalamin biosynthesis protein CobD [Thiospirillum jenense]
MDSLALLFISAVLLDALFGDPIYPFHPIRLIGHYSIGLEQWFFQHHWTGRLAGIIHWLMVVNTALAVWWIIHLSASQLHPLLTFGWNIFIAYSLLCTHDLLAHGRRVLIVLNDLARARQQVGQLVGRDTTQLTRAGVVRATIESLAENFTDGILTPLWTLALFGVPGLIIVKTISSLDSMVGHRTPRYQLFGWAAARSDDVIHWLPARLSPFIIATAAVLLNEKPRSAVRTAWRDHAKLPSPNSGWSEAAVAGALQVRLVGPLRYHGQAVTLPFIGDDAWIKDLDDKHLRRALRLIAVASGCAIVIGIALAVIV